MPERRFSLDLARKMELGHSFVRESVLPQQFALWVMLSQASTTRSVLRNWDIWSFIVSAPVAVAVPSGRCKEVGGRDRVGGLLSVGAIPCCVRGRPLAQRAFNCSIEALRDLSVRAGAVDGLCGGGSETTFSLAERLGRNGLDSFLLSLPGMGIGGGVSSVLISALAAATSALHDLARLRDFGRIEPLFEVGLVCSALSLAFSAAGVTAR